MRASVEKPDATVSSLDAGGRQFFLTFVQEHKCDASQPPFWSVYALRVGVCLKKMTALQFKIWHRRTL